MSKTLVKKALDLFEDDREDKLRNLSKKSRQAIKKTTKSTEEIFNKKGKKSKTLIETYIEKKDKNNMKSNLSYLRKMSKISLNYDQVKVALSKNKALASIKKNEESATSKSKSDKDEEGGFTEEDFKMFEKSYFNHK